MLICGSDSFLLVGVDSTVSLSCLFVMSMRCVACSVRVYNQGHVGRMWPDYRVLTGLSPLRALRGAIIGTSHMPLMRPIVN